MLPLLAVFLAAPPAVVTLPEPAVDAAVHPGRGTVAVVETGGALRLYPDLATKHSADNAASPPLPGKGVAVAFKRLGDANLFLVAVAAPPTLVLFDADAGTEVAQVPLAVAGPRAVRVSHNPADPVAYYTTASGGRSGGVGRVDLRDRRDLGRLAIRGTADALEVAGDGATVYVYKVTSAPTVYAHRIGPDGPTRVFERAGKADHCRADPAGDAVYFDGEVLSADLRDRRRTLTPDPNFPAFVSAARPLVVGLKARTVTILSSNDYRTGATAVLPAEWDAAPPKPAGKAARPIRPTAPPPVRLLEHPPSNTLLAVRGAKVGLVSLAGVPAEPRLAVGPLPEFRVGKPARVPLADPAVTAALVRGPAGLTVAGGALAWTPGEGDVGTHRATVTLTAGTATAERELRLVVGRDWLELPFAVRDFVVTDDGAFAVAAGFDATSVAGGPPVTRLAVVDLACRAVVCRRELPEPVRSVVADRHFVYAVADRGDVVVAYRLADLGDATRVRFPWHPTGLAAVGGRLLFAAALDGRMAVLAVPGFTRAMTGDVGAGAHLAGPGEPWAKALPVRVGDGWWFDGCLYDRELRQPRHLVQPTQFVANKVTGPDVERPPVKLPEPPADTPYPDWVAPHGTLADVITFRRAGVQVSLDPRNNGYDFMASVVPAVLADRPALVTVAETTDRGPAGERVTLTLRGYDLFTGRKGVEIPLRDGEGEVPGRRERRAGTRSHHVVPRGPEVVVAGDRQLFVAAVPLPPGAFREPLHFVPGQPVGAVGVGRATWPLPPLAGGDAPVAVGPPLAGVTVRPDGRLVAFAAGALEAVAMRALRAAFPTALAAQAEAYATRVAPLFERWVGRPPDGVPVWVRVGLSASAADGQTAVAEVGVFVEVPRRALPR